MLDASDALRAHAHCKERLASLFGGKQFHDPFFCELAPDPECALVRFLTQAADAGDTEAEPELIKARAAHAAMHCTIIDMAQRHCAGETIDVATEFGSNGTFGMRSTELIDAIWRLERKLHHTAA